MLPDVHSSVIPCNGDIGDVDVRVRPWPALKVTGEDGVLPTVKSPKIVPLLDGLDTTDNWTTPRLGVIRNVEPLLIVCVNICIVYYVSFVNNSSKSKFFTYSPKLYRLNCKSFSSVRYNITKTFWLSELNSLANLNNVFFIKGGAYTE